MITSKHITGFIISLMAVAVALCFVAIACSDALTEAAGGLGAVVEYESKLFDTDQPITIDITIGGDEWQSLLDNAIKEAYSECSVSINGNAFYNVGIRPKGNTSLSSIASNPDTDRYSFKLKFDEFVEGQTCFGLDKLILNNNYADATAMKEAIVYDMYGFLGADASLYNYAKISVNGEYWGVYLALEAVEDSFMLRNYGAQRGELYKPDSMEMGGGGNADMPGGDQRINIPDGAFDGKRPAWGDARDGNADGRISPDQAGSEDGIKERPTEAFADMKEGGGRNGARSGGANLNYTDDSLDSYSTIWDGGITDSGDADHRRVVTALKNVGEGTDLEEYLDVDNVLRYMAVHTFSVNLDSLSGSMTHNYYLYEHGGKLNILPWDYNLAFGGMSMGASGGASGMVNFPIDSPFASTEFFDALLDNEQYREQYHAYLQTLVDEYVAGGVFAKTYERIRSQTDALVRTDPTSFFTFEEYDAGARMLYDAVTLRAKSVSGQLSGLIPSTSEGQSAAPEALIDASSINIETMGTMGGNRGFDGGLRGGRGGQSE